MEEGTQALMETFLGREITIYWALGQVPQMTRGKLVQYGGTWIHLTQTQKGKSEEGHWWIRLAAVGAISSDVPG